MTLEFLTSPLLDGIRHGFFTRKGGASSGVFAGLNCGTGSSDQAEAVALNRTRAAEAMGLNAGGLATVHQVHSADVVTVSAPGATGQRADALVTATPGVGLSILTADCQPVLFADPAAGVIGAAHAGWRGARDGVLEATLTAMEELGADRANISAAIGPCISQAAYEVGPEFRQAFADQHTDNTSYFTQGSGDKFHFDLPAFGVDRLRAAGVGRVEWTGHCTYADPDRFYSFRRTTHNNEADYGRLIALIRL